MIIIKMLFFFGLPSYVSYKIQTQLRTTCKNLDARCAFVVFTLYPNLLKVSIFSKNFPSQLKFFRGFLDLHGINQRFLSHVLYFMRNLNWVFLQSFQICIKIPLQRRRNSCTVETGLRYEFGC